MVDKKINESGSTSFGGSNIIGTPTAWYSPGGTLGAWFAKFFHSKSKDYIAQQGNEDPNQFVQKEPLAGDTLTAKDVNRLSVTKEPNGPTLIRSIYTTQEERSRRERYRSLEFMDEFPEISSALDVYADNAVQKDTRGRRWIIDSDSPIIKREVERLFKNIQLETIQWDIIRNICKYGDCFIENVVDENNPKAGIQRLKVLNPNFIIRIENLYGYLTSFVQEIPQTNNYNVFGLQAETMAKSQYIPLDKNQVTHFRIHTSDPRFQPYGKPVAASVMRLFKSLRLMEDAMLVYRLARAPEKRVFYINTGNLPASKADVYMNKMKQKLRKDKMWNTTTQSIDERFNPMAVDEDLFIPHRGEKETKVEVLPGAQNLGDIDDVKYFLDKILAGMKVPRDYIVESKDKGAERKANLSQLDAKFANTVIRVQEHFVEGLTGLVRKHLAIRGMPQHLINELRIIMPDPSDIFTKRKLEIDEARARVISALVGTGLIPKDVIYKEYLELDELEIEEYKAGVKKDMEEQAEMQPMGMDPMGMGMEPGMEGGAETNAPGQAPNVGGRSGLIKQKQPGSAGMDSPANEGFNYLSKQLLMESDPDKLKTLKSIQQKLICENQQ